MVNPAGRADGRPAPAPPALGLRLGGAYAAFFLAMGIQLPYLPLWFQHRGLGPEAIGVALAVPMLVRLVSMPLLGLLSDRLGRPRALLVALALATVGGMGMLALSVDFLAILVTLAFTALAWMPSLSLLDSYASRQARAGLADYGKARQWGSASFLVANLVGGALIGMLGAGSVVLMMLAGQLAYVLATLALPELPRPEPRPAPVTGRRARLGVLSGIVAAALVQASHATLYAFASVSWKAQGYSFTAIGVLWAVGVAAEMALFRFGTRLVVRFGPHALIAVGGITAVVRFAAMASEPPLAVLVLLQLLHALTFAATFLAMVELVSRSVSEHRSGTGQTAAAWIGSILMSSANVASGPLWAAFGPLAFLVSSAIGLAGALAALLAVRLQPHSSGSGG
ncbi:MFS transporter [Xanthobacter oligotrophicus]|uniref:MFS transporter n=1 Tax=Xanthobacter oligotrophicus TaxID=2607286 RepID=UPI001E571E4C|nr:MFS transporter [Xanthobacter oligotrophicus]MCG5234039.1 MFS transporter [Xanthobacter oligotrophicus]